MNNIYLLIGGNMGNMTANLALARENIAAKVGAIITTSSIYKTAAWGLEDQPDFLNQVLEVETKLSAIKVLETVLKIEEEMGRVRKVKNGARLIDIDILFFGEEVIGTETLKVPHPLLHKRNFTLAPLAEIAPTFLHPVLKKNMQQLLQESEDGLPVEKLTGKF